jgi:hypothetical protein
MLLSSVAFDDIVSGLLIRRRARIITMRLWYGHTASSSGYGVGREVDNLLAVLPYRQLASNKSDFDRIA